MQQLNASIVILDEFMLSFCSFFFILSAQGVCSVATPKSHWSPKLGIVGLSPIWGQGECGEWNSAVGVCSVHNPETVNSEPSKTNKVNCSVHL